MALYKNIRDLALLVRVLTLVLFFTFGTAFAESNKCLNFYRSSDKILLGEGKFSRVYFNPNSPRNNSFTEKVYYDQKICREDVVLMSKWQDIFSRTSSSGGRGFSLVEYRHTQRANVARVQYVQGETLRHKLLDSSISEVNKDDYRNSFNSNVADAIRRIRNDSDFYGAQKIKPDDRDYEMFFRDGKSDGTSVFMIYLGNDFLIIKSDNIIIQNTTETMFVIDPR